MKANNEFRINSSRPWPLVNGDVLSPLKKKKSIPCPPSLHVRLMHLARKLPAFPGVVSDVFKVSMMSIGHRSMFRCGAFILFMILSISVDCPGLRVDGMIIHRLVYYSRTSKRQ